MADATADTQTDKEGEKEKATRLEPLFPCFSSPPSRTVGPPDGRQHELDFFRVEPNAPPEDARFKDNGIGKAEVQLNSELDLLSTPMARNGKRFSAHFHLDFEDEIPAPLSDSRRAGIRRASPKMKLDFLDAAISDKAGRIDKGLKWREAGSLTEVSSESKHAELKALDGAANKSPPGKEKLQDADERRQNASLERRGSCSGSPPRPRPSLEEKDLGGRQASPPSQGLRQKPSGSSSSGANPFESPGASSEEELPSGQSEQNLRSTDEILKRLIPRRVLEEEEQPQAKKARKSVKEATLCFDLNAEFTCDTSFFETEAFASKKKDAEARESDDAGLALTDMASANEMGLLRRQEAADDQMAHKYEGAKISEPGLTSLGKEEPETGKQERVEKAVTEEPEMGATSAKDAAGAVFTLSRKEAKMGETDPVWTVKGLSDQIVARTEDVRAREKKELVRSKLMEDLLHKGTGEDGAQLSSDPTKAPSQAPVPNGSGTGGDEVGLKGEWESLRIEGTACNLSPAVEEERTPTSSEHPRFDVSGAAKGAGPAEPKTQQSPRKEPEQLPEARTPGQCSVRLQVAKGRTTGSGDERTGEEGTKEQDSVHNEGRNLMHSDRGCGGEARKASLSVETGAAEDVLGEVSGQDKESPEAPGAFEEQKECSCGARSDEGGPGLTIMVAEALCHLK
jgi:hypothetical protein